MPKSLKNFLRFEDKIFWVDLEDNIVEVIEPDGSRRKATSDDANVTG